MDVFCHHIYEFKKGLRNLILHTTSKKFKREIETKLNELDISYLIYTVSEDKINVFFGNSLCIDIINRINKQRLNELTDEEDFMLGIMLGYSLLHQCERYLLRSSKRGEVDEIIG